MTTGAIRAGAAFVELLARDNLARGLAKGLATVRAWGAQVQAVGARLAALGVAAATPFGTAVAWFARTGDQLALLSQRTGLSVEALDRLQQSAERSGEGLREILEGAASGSTEAQAKLSRLSREAEQFQARVTGPQAQSAAALAQSWRQLQGGLAALVAVVGDALAPALTDLAGWIKRVVDQVQPWMQRNQDLIQGVALATAGVVVLGGALVGLGSALAMMAVAAGAALAAVKILISPLALLAAGAVAAGAALVAYTATGQQALGALEQSFASVKDVALSSWQGIKDALAAGDFGLAARVVGKTLEVAWLAATSKLKGAWREFRDFFLSAWDMAMAGLETAFNGAFARIRNLWNDFIAGFRAAWAAAKAGVVGGSAEEEIKAIQRQRDRQRHDTERVRQGVDQRIAQRAMGQAEERSKERAEAGRREQREIAQAMDELTEMTRAAAAGRARAVSGRPAAATSIPVAAAEASRKAEVFGGFNASALGRLGFGQTIEKDQLTEQKKTNDLLKGIDAKLGTAPLA